MTRDEIKEQQRIERGRCLKAILDSRSKKKVIVAGAGTGKTFTFSEVLKTRKNGNNLAVTFIRKLVADMGTKLGTNSEVKTFHAYCKKILHEQNGRVEIAPFLTKIIERDAELLGNKLSHFDEKFRTLDEKSPEIDFHLKRGDYYDAVGFDDSVYRLYKMVQNKPEILPLFDQIVVDEFQDFHALEVAFIEELSKKGNILIVGDDDQAVYYGRNASPDYLRKIHQSREFEKFELPFCSRCTEVIVKATNSLIKKAVEKGYFKGRIPKNYECYLADKETDSNKYPKIIWANCTTAMVVAKYVHSEILKIDPKDIAESNAKEKEYPSVLIIGAKQYLQAVDKQLRKIGISFDYTPSEDIGYRIVEAYEWLLRNNKSNLGWRILSELFLGRKELKHIIEKSEKSIEIVNLLDSKFVSNHLRAIELIQAYESGKLSTVDIQAELNKIIGNYYDEVISHFSHKEDKSEKVIDKTKPTILLTSFLGSKGLSAGHVFIIGANNGSIPRDVDKIKDVEISQFIVALTRTRKQCHIISNRWLVSPTGKDNKFVQPYQKSAFISAIPESLIENRGPINAKNFVK